MAELILCCLGFYILMRGGEFVVNRELKQLRKHTALLIQYNQWCDYYWRQNELDDATTRELIYESKLITHLDSLGKDVSAILERRIKIMHGRAVRAAADCKDL